MHETFEEIAYAEQTIYDEISSCLSHFKNDTHLKSISFGDYLTFRKSAEKDSPSQLTTLSSALSELLITLQPLYDRLLVLQERHAELARPAIKTHAPLWFKETTTDEKIIPPAHRTDPEEFLTDEFFYFINSVLDCSKLSSLDQSHIYSYLLKILATSIGQRLIVKMNRLHKQLQHKGSGTPVKLHIDYGSHDHLQFRAASTRLTNIQKVCSLSLTSTKDDAQFYKSNHQYHDPCRELVIEYPRNYHRKALSFTVGETTYITPELPFISFFHELIHALHYWRGRCRLGLSLKDPNSAIYHLFSRPSLFFKADAEEYWTIMLANTCENSIRKAYGLPLRGGHIGLPAISSHDDDRRLDLELTRVIALINARNERKTLPMPQLIRH